MLWQFIILLAVHWVADFCLQTHWQASNKSKNWTALARHVGVYTTVLFFAVPFIFSSQSYGAWFLYVAVNGALHFVTDAVTSRCSSRLFLGQLETITSKGANGWPDRERTALKTDFDPHNFFVMIGLDQLIHQTTLAATMLMFFV
jgi:hypothetical protein